MKKLILLIISALMLFSCNTAKFKITYIDNKFPNDTIILDKRLDYSIFTAPNAMVKVMEKKCFPSCNEFIWELKAEGVTVHTSDTSIILLDFRKFD